jgi:NAD-dependent SIR2 family protein deacetylase
VSKLYGTLMDARVRCMDCHEPLEARFTRPRANEPGDVILEVEPCAKCAPRIVADNDALDAAFEAERAAKGASA